MTQGRRFISTLTVLLIVLSLAMVSALMGGTAIAAPGTTYYVDDDRPDNTGDGLTPATAWKTISHASDNVSAGDTIIVAPGLYDNPNNGETFPVTIDRSLTLQSSSGATSTIINSNGSDVLKLPLEDTEAVTISGFTITGGGNGILVHNDGATSHLIDVSVTIINNVIRDNANKGIIIASITDGNTNITITGNTIMNNNDDGIEFEDATDGNSTITISSNTIRDNLLDGIQFEDDIDATSTVTIIGNTITNNAQDGIEFEGMLDDSSVVAISGNTISDSAADGIGFRNYLDDYSHLTINNNTISNSGEAGIDFSDKVIGEDTTTIISGNAITGGGQGIHFTRISGNSRVTVSNNSISENAANGVYIGDMTADYQVTVSPFNLIFGNLAFGLLNESGYMVNAENNWWGANDGPSASPGSGDSVSSNVEYTPWLVIGISANPATLIGYAATSTITADMTRNSDGQDTSAQGYIPNGTEIVFTTNNGFIGSTTVTKKMTSGRATASLTGAMGTATVCAKAPGHPEQSRTCTTVNFVSQQAFPGPKASPPLPTPAQITAKYLQLHPQQAYTGQPVTISANIANDGDSPGGYSATLKVDGKAEQTKIGSVDGHSSIPVQFTVTRSQPGTYTVEIKGQQASFTVLGTDGKTSGPPISGGLIALLVMVVLVLATAVMLVLSFRRAA
ncbi:nitrous oxide reductase family maturation protein NosD [Chloroflexota bacterium]